MRQNRQSAIARLKIWMVTATLCAALVLSPVAEASTKKKSANTPNPRYASIVIDAASGTVLQERYADKALHPASLVKMMTLLMAFEGLQNGTLTLNQRIRISNHAAAQSPSKLGLKPGSSITVKDAIGALVTKSANDIAVAMGEAIGGTESQFAYKMNQKAKEIGLTQTRFVNASGLHHPSQVSSARDMARLGRYLVMNYPAQYRYFSTRNFYYNGASYHNHNRLMETYQGMDGIKTGYIQPSGFNLVASAVRGDTRLIAVVFGGRTSQSRNAHMAELLDAGFAKMKSSGGAPRVAGASPNITTPALVASAKPIPVPTRKPGTAPTVAAMVQPPGAAPQGETQLAAISDDAIAQSPSMSEMAGEGDIDPAAARRLETGMMAIAAVKGERDEGRTLQSVPQNRIQSASFSPATAFENDDEWSIQIGAYTSRVRSDQALAESMKRLPMPLQNSAKPVIVPLKAGDAWVFRARIRGLTREQAVASCKYFNNCMAISPRAF